MTLPFALANLFTCPICFQPYRDPKVLPCLHSFCDSCLRRELPSQSFTLVCPVCRQQFILPPQGISSLQSHTLFTEFSDLYTNDTDLECNSDLENLYCSSHSGQTLRFYCSDCDSAICSSCTDIEHRDHRTMRLENAAMEQRILLQEAMEETKSQLEHLQTTKCDMQSQERNLEDKRLAIHTEIEQIFAKLLNALSLRKENLQRHLCNLYSAQTDMIQQDADKFAAKVQCFSDIVRLIERVLQRSCPLHLILLRKQLDARTVQLKSTIDTEPALNELTLKFDSSGLDEVESSISNFGAVHNFNTDGLITEISGSLFEKRQAVPSRAYRVYVTVKNHQGRTFNSSDVIIPPPKVHVRGPLPEDRIAAKPASDSAMSNRLTSSSQNSLSTYSDHSVLRSSPSPTPIRRVSCPLHSTSSTRASTPSFIKQRKPSFLLAIHVRDQGNSMFESVLTFPQEGQYEVNVTLADKHITGSPFRVHVGLFDSSNLPERKFSRNESTRRSTGSRRSESRLSQVSSKAIPIEDDLICRIGCRGRAKGEFTNPQDICCTSNGRILATDSNNQCVQVFSHTGEPRIRFGERGRLVGQLQRPTGVTVLPATGQYLIADYENRWISIFEPHGKYTSRFATGKLLGPKGIVVSNDNRILVVDNKASCICVFQTNGKFIGRFGSRGCAEDHLAGPHFIAVNSFGHSIISDFHNHAVKVFDTTGQFLYSFGSNGEGNGQFNAPTGIAVDPYDNILVADWGNSRIQVFDRQGSFLQCVNTAADPLYGPQGLTLTPEGNILVADSGNHCLKLYKYNNWVTSVSEID